MVRSLITISIVLGVLAVSAAAQGSDPVLPRPADPAAREHFTRGNRLYNVRAFDEAAAQYIAGAVVEAAPVFDFNLGQCYRQLGKYQDAIWHYERFLRHGQPPEVLRRHVVGFIAQMKSELAKAAMTQPPTEPATDLSESRSQMTSTPAGLSEQAESSSPWYADTLGWGLAGAGLANVGVAGWLFVSASSYRADANQAPSEDMRSNLRATAERRTLVGTVVGIGGVALLMAGAIKLAIHSDGRARAQAASWELGISRGGFVVSCDF